MADTTTINNEELNNESTQLDMQDATPLLLLNLGCGNDIREDYKNIDIIPINDEVIHCDVRELEFAPNSVDGILALHVLQCFPIQELPQILKDWYELLKEGAEVVVSVPSLALAAEEFCFENWSAAKFNTFIFGDQTNEGNFYLSAFDVPTLRNCFEESPFLILSIEEDLSELSIILRAIKPVKEYSSKIKLFIESTDDDDFESDEEVFQNEWDEEDFDDDIEQPDDFYDDDIIVDENFEREIEAEIELFKNQISEIEEEFSEIIRNDIEETADAPIESIDIDDSPEDDDITDIDDEEFLSSLEIDEEDEDINEDVDLIQSINEDIELDIDLFEEEEEAPETETIEDTEALPLDFEDESSLNVDISIDLNDDQEELEEDIEDIDIEEEEEEIEDELEDEFEELIDEKDENQDGFTIDIDIDLESDEEDLDDEVEEDEVEDFEIEIVDIDTPETDIEEESASDEDGIAQMDMTDEEYASALNKVSIPVSATDYSLEIPLSNDEEMFDDSPEDDDITDIDDEEFLSSLEIDEEDEDINEDVDLIQSINEDIELDIDLFEEEEEAPETETIEDTEALPLDFEDESSLNVDISIDLNDDQEELEEDIEDIDIEEEEEEIEDELEDEFEELIDEKDENQDGFTIDIDIDLESDEEDLDDEVEEDEVEDFEIEIVDIDTPETDIEEESASDEDGIAQMDMTDEEYASALNKVSIPVSATDYSLEIPLSNDEEMFDDFPEIEEESTPDILPISIIETAFSDDSDQVLQDDIDITLDSLLEQSIVDDSPKIDFAFSSIEEQPVDVKVPEKQLNIFWEGSQFTYHSLALINREHCYNLLRAGVSDVTILPYEEDTFEPEGEKFEALKNVDIRYKQEWETTTSGLPTVLIRHTWPPRTDAPNNAKWIVMQPWEFSELRSDFVDVFQRADEVWVPSHFVRNIYVKAGISPDKVQVIPNGVNPQLFTPLGDLYPLETTKECKFLYVGGTIYRKGIDVLLQSYVATFTKDDSVTLVIKDLGGDSFYKGQTAQSLIKEIQQNPDAPEIIYIDEQLTEEEMASLYRACSVFVSPYRGEGFSLPTLEAMSSGLPVIVTQGGPTDEFVNEECGWIIPSKHTYIGNRFGNYDLTGNAYVLEPDKEALSDSLLRAFAFPYECVQKGLNGSIIARTQLTWNLATMKALKRLDVLYNTTMADEAADTLQDIPDSSTIFAQAEVAFREKDFDIAIELYNTVYTIRGISPKLALLGVHRLAMIGLHDNEIEFVQDCLIKADEFVVDHPDTLYLKASLMALQQQWVEASELLNRLIENWDTYRYQSLIGIRLTNLLCAAGNAVYYGSAELEDRTEEVSAAHQLYSASLKDDPDNAEACYGTALCFYEFGLLDDAKKMVEWAIQISPDFTAATDLLLMIQNEATS
jgi:glycosyltransferase involved in cell wall biosynthesis